MATYKVILVGEPGVGKTQLLRSFAGETFCQAHTPTRGVECTPVVVFFEGREVTLQLWDTATWWCQDRFRPVTSKQYLEAHAVVYVYDCTNYQTLSGLRAAFDEVVRCNEDCVKILVGTKYDLILQNLINKPLNQGVILAQTLSLPYFEVSSKVAPPSPDTAFFSLARTLLAAHFDKRSVSNMSLSQQALAIAEEKYEGDSVASPTSAGKTAVATTAPTTTRAATYNAAAAAAFQGGSAYVEMKAAPTPTATATTTPATTTTTPTPARTPAPYVAASPLGPAVTAFVIRTPPPAASNADPFGVNAVDYDKMYNVVLLGDEKVGKTQLLRSFLEEEFSEDYVASSAMTSCSKIFDVEGRKIKLTLWDTPGSTQAKAAEALSNAHGVLILYDMTEMKTFESCRGHFERAQKGCSQNARVLLAGNKTDLQDKTVDYNEGNSLAAAQKAPFFEISARAAFNVETMFRALVRAIRTVPANR